MNNQEDKRELLEYALEELTETDEAVNVYKEALLEHIDNLSEKHLEQIEFELEVLKDHRRQAREIIEEITGFKGV